MRSSKKIDWIRCTVSLRAPVDVATSGRYIGGLLGTEPIDVLAKEPPHLLLANLPDDERASKKFLMEWGLFMYQGPLRRPNGGQLFVPDSPQDQIAQKLLRAHPQASDGPPSLFVEDVDDILGAREVLRKAWTGDAIALAQMRQRAEEILNTPGQLKGGNIEIPIRHSWTAVCFLFLRDLERHKIGVCENRINCPTPFFLKSRVSQKVCSADQCIAFARRQNKLNWWRTKGNEWRAAQRRKSRRGSKK